RLWFRQTRAAPRESPIGQALARRQCSFKPVNPKPITTEVDGSDRKLRAEAAGNLVKYRQRGARRCRSCVIPVSHALPRESFPANRRRAPPHRSINRQLTLDRCVTHCGKPPDSASLSDGSKLRPLTASIRTHPARGGLGMIRGAAKPKGRRGQ